MGGVGGGELRVYFLTKLTSLRRISDIIAKEFPWQCIILGALASAANPNTTFPLFISQRSSKDPEMFGCSVAAILALGRLRQGSHRKS